MAGARMTAPTGCPSGRNQVAASARLSSARTAGPARRSRGPRPQDDLPDSVVVVQACVGARDVVERELGVDERSPSLPARRGRAARRSPAGCPWRNPGRRPASSRRTGPAASRSARPSCRRRRGAHRGECVHEGLPQRPGRVEGEVCAAGGVGQVVGERRGGAVDDVWAPSLCAYAAFSAPEVTATTSAPEAAAIWIAMLPTPEDAAPTITFSPAIKPTAGDEGTPCGQAGQGKCRGLGPVEMGRFRIDVRRRYGDVLGVGAVRRRAQDLVARRRARRRSRPRRGTGRSRTSAPTEMPSCGRRGRRPAR